MKKNIQYDERLGRVPTMLDRSLVISDKVQVRNWPSAFERLEGKDVMPVLLDGLRQFKNRQYWISAGTLLGLERDNRFIPHDTDLDIAVRGNEEIVMPHGYLPVRFIDYDNKPMQRAYIHKSSQIIFDIFHYYDDGEEIYNTQEKGTIRRSRCLVEPLKRKKYLGYLFNVPNDVDAYLTEWYGNWRVPIMGGKTEWHKD